MCRRLCRTHSSTKAPQDPVVLVTMKRLIAIAAAITLLAPSPLASADEFDVLPNYVHDDVSISDVMEDGTARSLAANTTAPTTTVAANNTSTRTATAPTTYTSSSTAAPTTPKPRIVIKGSLGMKVSNPAGFVTDPAVKASIGVSIAKLVGVSKDFVNVTLRVVARRLTIQPRRLEEGSVEAEYSIAIPEEDIAAIQQKVKETSAADFSSRVSAEMAARGLSSFTIFVTSVSAPSAPTLEVAADENATNATTTTTARAPANAVERCSPGIFAASLLALAGFSLAY